MKIEAIKNRMNARKRGADMTQALLYAAFAIVVLISVLAMYQVVTLNSNKTTAARTVSTAAQEARTLFRNSVNFTGLDNEMLIQAGAVPTDAISGTETITLPYQGSIDFEPTAAGADEGKFQATVELSATRGGRALCTFLSSGATTGEVITGPMGAEYKLASTPAKACDATTGTNTFAVIYER